MSLYAVITQQVYQYPGQTATQTYGMVFVSIYDSVTNQPANGNNCEVTYTQNINKSESTLDVIVPGLSIQIYNGLLKDTAPSPNEFFTTFTIDDIVAGNGTGTGPGVDDLTIVNVLTTPETNVDANDGTLTVTATSSYPAIQYSIDDVNWQTSNVFSGLISGSGTVYVKDANGGALSAPYTVGLLSNVLVTDPSVNLGNGNVSRWNAAFNNIWFKYQRKDFQVTSVVNDGNGNLLVNVNANMSTVVVPQVITSQVPNVPTIYVLGETVYLSTALYQGLFQVLAASAGTVTLAGTFTANDTIGFINIDSQKPYYNIQTKITAVNPVTGQFVTLNSTNYPKSDGSCQVDLQNYLKTLLQVKDASQYNLINFRDSNLSASFTIAYAEVWSGNTPNWIQITRPYYVLFAAMQLQQLGGGNLYQYVPYPLGFQPAKWLSDFLNPYYNPNFPFDLGFIFSEYMTTLNPFVVFELLDINQNPLQDQSVDNEFLLNQDGSFILNQDASKFIIASQALSNTPIVQNVGLNRLLINLNLPSICYFLKVQILYTAGGTTYPLTQPITCRVFQDTPDRQVYLRWIGLLGTWNYYTFVYNQDVSLIVNDASTLKNFITDWQNSDTIEDVISKSAGEKMVVYAENVSIADIQGLQPIKFSPKVQMLTNDQPPFQWQTVIVDTGTFKEYETMLPEDSFSISFALPSKNTQYQ